MLNNLVTVEEAVTEPVSLEDIYTFLRLDTDGSPPSHPDDDMLRSFITAAREKVEQVTRRTLTVGSTLKAIYSRFPVYKVYMGGTGFFDDDFEYRNDAIELPRPPINSVSSVQYYDEDNVLRTFSTSNWFLVNESFTAKVVLVDGYTWPSTFRRDDALQITFTSGYEPIGSPNPATNSIPELIKVAIMVEVQLMYDELSPDKRKKLEESIDRMLVSFRVYSF